MKNHPSQPSPQGHVIPQSASAEKALNADFSLEVRAGDLTPIERELVRTRDMLDAELTRQRNIHAFGELAREAKDVDDFCLLAAKHITSIFGLRASAFFVFGGESDELVKSSSIGMESRHGETFPAEDLAISWRDTQSEKEGLRKTAIIYNGSPGGAVRRMNLEQVILCPCYDAAHHLVALLVGARSQADRDETEPLTDAFLPSFTMFSEHAGGVLAQLRNLDTISSQLEANKRAEEMLTLAIDAAQIGTWDRNQISGMAHVNEFWASIVGFTKAELGPPWPRWKDCTHPDDYPAARAAFDAHLRGETEIYEASYRMRHKLGHWVWILDRGRVMERDSNGTAIRVCGTHIDISEAKTAEAERLELEKQIQQSQKLESLGVLAGGVAHDFNNILTVIQANAELALCSLPEASQIRCHLEEIERGSKRAAGLATQMLAFAGRGKLVVESIDLTALVNEMIQLLTVSISKNIVLKHREMGGKPWFEGDSSQIRQVVMNLIINASEAIGEDNGEISISTGAIYCDEEFLRLYPKALLGPDTQSMTPGPYILLEVKDDGCGMDEETKQKVFEPFFTTKFTGRGLGMAALLGILHGHGGALRFESEVGKGAKFTILLPANETARVGKTWSQADQSDLSSDAHGTVLLVDDEQGIRKIGTRLLERLGYTVLTARDGIKALEIVRERGDELACVVLDLTMPRMGGEETHRKLRQLYPELGVVLSSGYMEREATERFGALGLAGYLQKPYSLQDLKDKVASAIAKTY